MTTIEQSMQVFFKSDKEKRINIENKKEIDKTEPITISVQEEAPKTQSTIKIPIAWIGSVTEGSPADEAGLKAGDGIINFDKSVYYGVSNNPLQKIAEIVGKKIGHEILVEIIRKDEENKVEYLNITLVPHSWEGQGVLGCKLNLSENK